MAKMTETQAVNLLAAAAGLAAQLAVEAGGALTASSANLSGGESVRCPQQLDPALMDALQQLAYKMPWPKNCPVDENRAQAGPYPLPLLIGGPLPAGGLPSTVVEPLGGAKGGAARAAGGAGRLRMVRAGAVSAAELVAAGFSVE